MYETPAAASFLDLAADCIEAGDEIGRLVYLRAHAAGLQFSAPVQPIAFETVINVPGRYFPAKYAGRCSVSGIAFYPGADIYMAADGGTVALATIRAWEFAARGDLTVSPWVRPTPSIMDALNAGQMVATLNNLGIKRYWMLRGDKVEETSCIGTTPMQSCRKSPAAFWSTVASKGQAVRVAR